MDATTANRSPNAHRKSFPLQYIRSFAALLVVLFHASIYTKVWRADSWFLHIFEGYINAGQLGVTLFFVTSGALMAQLASGVPSRFLLHRIVRVYPIYLIVALTMLQFATLLATNVTFDPWALGLISGAGHHYGLGVAWTLPFEITF